MIRCGEIQEEPCKKKVNVCRGPRTSVEGNEMAGRRKEESRSIETIRKQERARSDGQADIQTTHVSKTDQSSSEEHGSSETSSSSSEGRRSERGGSPSTSTGGTGEGLSSVGNV